MEPEGKPLGAYAKMRVSQGGKQGLEVIGRFFCILVLSFALAYFGAYLPLDHWIGLPFEVTPVDSLEGGAVFSSTGIAAYFLLGCPFRGKNV